MTSRPQAPASFGLKAFVVSMVALAAGSAAVHAQGLDWEGRTGAVLTPFAGTAGSPGNGAGRVSAAFHLLAAGDVVGTHIQLSATLGFFGRVEAGVTRSAVSVGRPADVSSLFDRGFTTLHAKVNLVAERAGGTPVPAVSIGGLYHWQHEHIGTEIRSDPTKSGELYLVASRRFDVTGELALLASVGVRETRAVFFGIAGNAPSGEVRAFASGGVVVTSMLFAGVEWLQQPGHLDGVPAAGIPATATAFVRASPGRRVSVDVALVRLAGVIAPGIDLEASRALLLGFGLRF